MMGLVILQFNGTWLGYYNMDGLNDTSGGYIYLFKSLGLVYLITGHNNSTTTYLMKKCYVSVLISVVKLSFNRNEYRLILCQQQRQNKWCKRSIG